MPIGMFRNVMSIGPTGGIPSIEWSELERGLGNPLFTDYRGVSYANGLGMACMLEGRLSRTYTDGATWEALTNLPWTDNDGVLSVCVGDNGTTLIGNEGLIGIFRTVDGGDSWTSAVLPVGYGNQHAVTCLGGGEWISSGSEGNIIKSIDDGQTFSDTYTFSQKVWFLGITVVGGRIIGCGTNSTTGEGVIYYSDNGGVSWVQSTIIGGLSSALLWEVAASGNTVIVTRPSGVNSEILVSKDAGETFTAKQVGVNAKGVVKFGNNWLVASTGSTLIISGDDFETWENLPVVVSAPTAVGFLLQIMGGNIVYLCDEGYALISPPATS